MSSRPPAADPSVDSAVRPAFGNVSRLVWFLALGVGLLTSLKTTLTLFRVDPDTVHSLLLWDGIRREGLAWLGDWLGTQDNWLLSLCPFHFLAYSIFGPAPEVAVVGGWIIFVLSAATAGLIAWRLGGRRAAFFIPVILLFSGRYVHAGGFASYAISHNITNLYGLAALALILQWLRRGGDGKLAVLAWLLVAGGVSDPWMLPAWQLPILLAAVAAAAWPALYRGGRTTAVKLALVAALSIVAVKTKLFGALGFLPSVDYQVGNSDTFVNNIGWLFRNLGGMLSLVPNDTPAMATSWAGVLIALAAITALLAIQQASAVRRRDHWEPASRMFAGIALLSVGGISAAYVIGSVPADISSARFLLNVQFLVVIALAVLIDRQWQAISGPQKIAAILVPLLFVVAGITSNLAIWARPGFHVDDSKSRQLIEFLRENHLSEGYGPYWGSYANAVTAVSGFTIHLRPVVFDRTSGEMVAGARVESSRRWGRPEVSAPGAYFVMVKADGEECPNPEICIAGLRRQFGPPARELRYQDATVLVWDHPLIGYRPS